MGKLDVLINELATYQIEIFEVKCFIQNVTSKKKKSFELFLLLISDFISNFNKFHFQFFVNLSLYSWCNILKKKNAARLNRFVLVF